MSKEFDEFMGGIQKEDKTLIKPNEKDLFGASSKEDYLYDLVNQNK